MRDSIGETAGAACVFSVRGGGGAEISCCVHVTQCCALSRESQGYEMAVAGAQSHPQGRACVLNIVSGINQVWLGWQSPPMGLDLLWKGEI